MQPGTLLADLFNRSLNLAFNGSEKRSALRAKRAQVKKKNDQAKARNRVGGFAIPFAYAQQQLGGPASICRSRLLCSPWAPRPTS